MAAFGEQALTWYQAERVDEAPALSVLVRDHSALLFRVAFSILRNPAEAEDVVQDTFLRVLHRPAALSGIADTRAWLIRIAWNLALDRLRRIRPGQMDPAFAAQLIAPGLPADLVLHTQRRIDQVLAAIDRLPNLERQALLLSAIDELSTSEVAAILGRSQSSVRSLLYRARTHLKQRLGEEKPR